MFQEYSAFGYDCFNLKVISWPGFLTHSPFDLTTRKSCGHILKLTAFLRQRHERELRLIAPSHVVSLDLQLVDGARLQVRHDEPPLHLHAVRHQRPVELVDGPVLNHEVQDGAAIIGPHVKP